MRNHPTATDRWQASGASEAANEAFHASGAGAINQAGVGGQNANTPFLRQGQIGGVIG